MVQKEIKSPNGKDKSKVIKNKQQVTAKPSSKVWVMVKKSIKIL